MQEGREAILRNVFTPLSREIAAVSPNRTYLAYPVRVGSELFVLVVPTADPSRALARVKVGTKESSQFIPPPPRPMSLGVTMAANPRAPSGADLVWKPMLGMTPPAILAMEWVGESRLVVSTNLNAPRYGPSGYGNVYGAVMAFNADGSNAKLLATTSKLGASGSFDVLSAERGEVIFKTTSSRLGPGSVVLNIHTGRIRHRNVRIFQQARRLTEERQKALRAQVDAVVTQLQDEFPGQHVGFLDSDERGDCMALRLSSRGDPGRLHLYFPRTRKLLELGSCASSGESRRTQSTRVHTQLADGDPVQSVLTFVPRPLIGGRPRLAVVCPNRLTATLQLDYRHDVLALLSLGFDVLEVGGRRKERVEEDIAKGESLEYVLEVAESVRRRYGVSEARTAVVGLGRSSSDLAMEFLLSVPHPYRCALLFEPRFNRRNLERWKALRGRSPLPDSSPDDRGQLLCLYTGGRQVISDRRARGAAEEYCEAFTRGGRWVADFAPVPFATRLQHEEEWTAVYLKIGDFFDRALLKPQVNIGELKKAGPGSLGAPEIRMTRPE